MSRIASGWVSTSRSLLPCEVVDVVLEAIGAEVRRSLESERLDHGAHRAVEHEDALAGEFGERVIGEGVGAGDGHATPFSDSPDELRSMIHAGRRMAATARVAATAPWTGTHFIASYQVTGDHRWASPGHSYSTASVRQMPGLNLYVRQTIPGLGMLPWRMEATADLRNMLAQGYLSLGIAGGQQLMLVENPRSVRGGLSFIF